MNDTPIYNKVGKGYNTTRNADAYLTGRMYELLAPVSEGKYIDIGCGTGNYTAALSQKGLHMKGIDPSERMLEQALKKHSNIDFIKASSEQLPFENNSFNGATAIFTVHHWSDINAGLKEIYRILKPGSKLVMLSFTPEQIMNYWLCKYFPITMQNSSVVVLPQQEMEQVFFQAGFNEINTEKYFVHEELTDFFLYANKYRPERYLDAEIRNGASSFTVYADQEEVKEGLVNLERDIKTGLIENIINDHENDMGDYLFYVATKK